MTGQKLYIKNMVCSRCIMVVQQELDKLGLKTNSVTLGEAVLVKEPTAEEKNKWKQHWYDWVLNYLIIKKAGLLKK
jgi:copper chaperone CopZ